jgi:integrase
VIEDTLTRFPGVYRRADSGIYQFGLRAPKDLLTHFASGWAVRCSLGTADLREANQKATALQAQWAATFAGLRSGEAAEPVPESVDLPKLRARLLHDLERALVNEDARHARMSPAERADSARNWAWQRDYVKQGLEEGYSLEEVLDDWVPRRIKRLGVPHTPLVEAEVLGAYIAHAEATVEALTDATRTFPLRAQMLAARRALALEAMHDERETVTPRHAGSAQRRTIADALTQWKGAKCRPAKTVQAFARHADVFIKMMGDLPLASWDRTLARQFRDRLTTWARTEGKTASTADNVLLSVKTLARVAQDEGWVQGDPFSRLTVTEGGKQSEGREPWRHEELVTLFDDPIWRAKGLPLAAKAGGAAAYWMPLIACYTGARLSEIAQLWTDDVDTDAGAECLEFRASVERRQDLKNANSWRAVPMHRELVRLGLPAYAQSLPVGPLFPMLRVQGKNGAGGVFGTWFGEFKARKGFGSPVKSFHSFRHLVSTELQLKNVSEALRNPILGHAGEGMGEKTYGTTIRRSAQRLRPYVELLDFPLRSLPAFGWA